MRYVLMIALAFASTPAWAGYAECDDGGARWVTTASCPSSVDRVVYTSCRGNTSTGERVSAQCSNVERVAVQSRSLTRGEFCDALHAGSATSNKRMKESDAAYERNKLKTSERC